MPMAEVDEVMKHTNTVDDEEGYIKYSDFVKKIMAGPKA